MLGTLGLGTYTLTGKKCTQVVSDALDLGYRLFDTASAYGNHEAIGGALVGFDRSQIQLISKIWIDEEVDDADIKGSIERACDKALKELSTDYLDAYLIHWPNRSRPMEEMLRCLVDLKQEGKIKAVGVSNFTEHHLQDAYDAGIELSWNQIEVHPLLSQRHLIDFARSHGTKTIAYRPFGKGKLLHEIPLFSEIGDRHGKSPAQVVLRWLLERGLTVIPKASSYEHLKENFDVFDFALTEEETKALDGLNRDFRTCEKEFSEFDY
jgi:diketogulonate reductase-like aldo/keto reductase